MTFLANFVTSVELFLESVAYKLYVPDVVLFKTPDTSFVLLYRISVVDVPMDNLYLFIVALFFAIALFSTGIVTFIFE